MTVTLSTFRTRILLSLGDANGNRYATTQVDEALRLALAEYSQANPALFTATHTAVTTSRLQPVSGLTGLRFFTQVSWPDLTIPLQTWYPVSLAGTPYIHFTGPTYPTAGDSIALTYAAQQTITDLDDATSTTLPDIHTTFLAGGAAAHAAIARSIGITEQMTSRASNAGQLLSWGEDRLLKFRAALAELAIQKSATFPPLTGWKIDRWDRHHS
jgi:hypothetical protein